MKYKADQIFIDKLNKSHKVIIISINGSGYNLRTVGHYIGWYVTEKDLDTLYDYWLKPKLDYLIENV